jgi:hypothetical protein
MTFPLLYFSLAFTILHTAHQNDAFLPSAVIHACNPSYWGGRDWEVCISRPALAKLFMRPHLDQKKAGHGMCLSFQPQKTQKW